VLSILYEIERHNLAIDGEIIELLLRNAAVGIGVDEMKQVTPFTASCYPRG
jgi:hypothetical protein